MVEAKELQISPEEQPYLNVVRLLERSGYQYEPKATHEDPDGHIHFNKQDGSRFYPHFHFIYIPDTESIKIHIDVRMHKTRNMSPKLSDEQQRLYGQFTILSQIQDKSIARIASNFSKQMLEQSMFRTSQSIAHDDEKKFGRMRVQTRRNKKLRLRKQNKHQHSEKKYKLNGDFDEVLYIADWEPINPILNNEVNRQLETKTDNIT